MLSQTLKEAKGASYKCRQGEAKVQKNQGLVPPQSPEADNRNVWNSWTLITSDIMWQIFDIVM